jgi:hypothetical protein
MTTCRYINSGQSNFEYEYLGEFETEFKNIPGHESGAQVCLFDGKKQRLKISCYCPFKQKYVAYPIQLGTRCKELIAESLFKSISDNFPAFPAGNRFYDL